MGFGEHEWSVSFRKTRPMTNLSSCSPRRFSVIRSARKKVGRDAQRFPLESAQQVAGSTLNPQVQLGASATNARWILQSLFWICGNSNNQNSRIRRAIDSGRLSS